MNVENVKSVMRANVRIETSMCDTQGDRSRLRLDRLFFLKNSFFVIIECTGRYATFFFM